MLSGNDHKSSVTDIGSDLSRNRTYVILLTHLDEWCLCGLLKIKVRFSNFIPDIFCIPILHAHISFEILN